MNSSFCSVREFDHRDKAQKPQLQYFNPRGPLQPDKEVAVNTKNVPAAATQSSNFRVNYKK